jgi:hypothetical protein
MVSRNLFIIVLALAMIAILVSTSGSFRIDLAKHYFAIASVLLVPVIAFVLIKFRHRLLFNIRYKKRSIEETSQLAKLLDLNSLVLREGYVLAQGRSKVVGHAYFRISNVPYLLDDLDKEKKMWYVGNFVRLLASLNFPFEMIPRIMPVPASVYLSQVNKEIDNLKLTLSAEGSTANPKRQARLKYLEKVAQRLLEGEGTRDVSFLCHIMVEGKDEQSILKDLEANAKTLMSTLESGLNVRAERLRGSRMLEVLREFFPATMKINPRKTNRMLAWDLAYLVPLARPKLPPLEKLLTGVYLGRTTGNSIACLDINRYANPHIAVLGKSGYGKSTTVKTLISRMYDLWELPVLIIDYAGEYAPWVHSRNGLVVDMQTSSINPFELGPATLTDRMRQLIDTFQSISDLTLQQRNSLAYYITKAYSSKGFKPDDPLTWKGQPPTLQEIIDMMNKDIGKVRSAKQWTLMALIEKLQVLASGPLDIFRKSKFSINDLTRGFVCIDLSRVTSSILKDIVSQTILQHIDTEMRLKGIQNKVVQIVVLDEAWKLSREENSLPVTIIKEGRKYGYSLIVSSQDATADLAESILANAGTAIIHHTEHPKYTSFFESSYGLTVQEIMRIKNAPIGEALVKIGDDPRPFFVRVEMEDPMEDEKGSKTQALPAPQSKLINDFVPSVNISAPRTPRPNISAEKNPDNLSYYARKLLDHIAEKPDENVTTHYDHLLMNRRTGNKAKDELQKLGLIEEIELPSLVGFGRSGKLLKLSKTGYQFLNRNPETHRFGGSIHRHLINLIANRYHEHHVRVEKPHGDGKMTDLVIDDRIAFEVETRDFSEENIRKNLAAGYERVIVVCPSKVQCVKFRSILAQRFPDEKRVMVIDIASLLKRPIEVL